MGEVGSWGRKKVGRGSVSQVIGSGQGEVACLRHLRKGAGPEQEILEEEELSFCGVWFH